MDDNENLPKKKQVGKNTANKADIKRRKEEKYYKKIIEYATK